MRHRGALDRLSRLLTSDSLSEIVNKPVCRVFLGNSR
jgi:hypothetical protein